METAGSPKFPGNPRDHSPCSPTPVGPSRLSRPWVSCLARPPRLTRTRAHHEEISGLNRTAFDLAVYASSWRLPAIMQDSLPAAGPALPGGIGYPQGSCERFHGCNDSPFPSFLARCQTLFLVSHSARKSQKQSLTSRSAKSDTAERRRDAAGGALQMLKAGAGVRIDLYATRPGPYHGEESQVEGVPHGRDVHRRDSQRGRGVRPSRPAARRDESSG